MFGENKLKSYTLCKLDSDDFELFIGDRVIASEIVTNGKYPVFSANVYEAFGRIDKQNITDFGWVFREGLSGWVFRVGFLPLR